MRLTTRRVLAFGFAALLGLAAQPTLAVSAYETGDSFLQATDEEYRHGYVAGAVDMLASLQDGGLLGEGAFADQTQRMMACLKDKTVDDIQAMYQKRLKDQPAKSTNAAASSIYFAIKDACNVR